jgi:hypothetical protein
MVDKTTLIFIPLLFMFAISMTSLIALSEGELGSGYNYSINEKFTPYIYDRVGRPVMYTANLSAVTEGEPVFFKPVSVDGTEYAFYSNSTIDFILNNGYYLYYTSSGNSTGESTRILWEDLKQLQTSLANTSVFSAVADFNTSYGLIALFIALMVGMVIAGINVFGTGESETSLQTIFMGVGLLAVWGVFSVISITLLGEIPYGLGSVFYFGLTLCYVVGMIMNIGKST